MNGMRSLKNKFCSKPFEHFEVAPDGKVSLCCFSWLPHHAGKIDKNNSVKEVFNSDVAKKIRTSIHDGSFKYCNWGLCPLIQNDSLPEKEKVEPRFKEIVDNKIIDDLRPKFYNLCYDYSCNLSCPSCRTDKISNTCGSAYEKSLEIQNEIIKEVFGKPHNEYCLVNVTGSGDPFGSKLFRELLFNIDGAKFPRVFFNLQTNGVMFTPKYWDKMKKIQNNINTVIISIDAGTKETYDVIRRGGDWDQLHRNLEFISELRQQNKVKKLRLDVVTQVGNYKEMPLVVEIGKKYKVDSVYFSRIINWGAFSKRGFKKEAVWRKNHPEFNEFIKILQNPIFNDPIVDLGNLTEYKRDNN